MPETSSNTPSNQQPTFTIGTIPVFGNAILAPMDGLSDSPFRQLCRQMGSALSISEFVNAYNFVCGHPHRERQFPFDPIERPFAYQIFDNDIDRICTTALFLMNYKPDFIDINMGCSNRSVSARGAGAGMMKNPKMVAKLMSKLVEILPVPVTAKIRLGWSENEQNFLEIGKILEDNGCSCIALHARTRVQQYGGKADWDAIARLVQHISIPIIGNGDILEATQIDEMIAYTQCKAVMIGRGSLGNPWIFSRITKEQLTLYHRVSVMEQHLAKMISYYGTSRGVILFRKHIKHYLKDVEVPASFFHEAYLIDNGVELAQYLQNRLV
jgi:nifR3 family TIM-barrel protein